MLVNLSCGKLESGVTGREACTNYSKSTEDYPMSGAGLETTTLETTTPAPTTATPAAAETTTTPASAPKGKWSLSRFSCCTSANSAVKKAIGDPNNDGKEGTWDDVKFRLEEVNQNMVRASEQLQQALKFISKQVNLAITLLNLLKLAEETPGEGLEPSQEAIQFLSDAINVLTKVDAGLNGGKEIVRAATELKIPTTVAEIAANANATLELNKEIRKAIQSVNGNPGTGITIDLSGLDAVDKAVKKMLQLYKVGQIAIALSNTADATATADAPAATPGSAAKLTLV